MFIVGGICAVIIGGLNSVLPWKLGLIWQCLLGGGIITAIELIAGIILYELVIIIRVLE